MPTAGSYTSTSDRICGGRRWMPAWLRGKPLNTWFQIPGTDTGTTSAINEYSNWAYRPDTGEFFTAASGGHSVYSNNGVYRIRVLEDAPVWSNPTPGSAAADIRVDVAYYDDNKPSSRHSYWNNHWVPAHNRVMLFGAVYVYGSAVTFPSVDGWSPDTAQYDPPGTWPNTPDGREGSAWNSSTHTWVPGGTSAGGYAGVRIFVPELNEGYTGNWNYRYRPGIGYDSPVSGTLAPGGANQMAYDPSRNQIFTMAWGNGMGDAPERGLTAALLDRSAMVRRQVTLTGSGLSQLVADASMYAGLCFDPVNDCYYFYEGRGSHAGRVYKITPVTGSYTWDVSLFTYAAGAALPPASADQGVCGRFTYVPELRGVVMLPSTSAGLYFMRTA